MTGVRHAFHYGGLHIESDLELPELRTFASTLRAQPDVLIGLGDAAPATELGWTFEGSRRWTLGIPGVACFDVSEGRRITIRPEAGAAPSDLRLFLLGSAWAGLCEQRGLLLLHAGIVAVGDGAVAFCGPSGAGKSSTVGLLVRRGLSLVSDDLTVCTSDGDRAIAAWPSIPRLRLWPETVDALGWERSAFERDRPRVDKLVRSMDGVPASAPVPLRAIYVLGWGPPEVSRLTGLDAVRALVASATYRAELLLPQGSAVAAQWQRMLVVARAVPVWRLQRERGWESMDLTLSGIVGLG